MGFGRNYVKNVKNVLKSTFFAKNHSFLPKNLIFLTLNKFNI